MAAREIKEASEQGNAQAIHEFGKTTLSRFEERVVIPAIHTVGSVLLSNSERALLALGLKFIPVPPSLSSDAPLVSAINQLFRSIRLRNQFDSHIVPRAATPIAAQSAKPLRHSNPSFQPKALSRDDEKVLRVALARCRSSFSQPSSLRTRSNLLASLRYALRILRSRTDIVIKNADKGLGVTVMESSWYKTQCLSHLEDAKIFEEVKYIDRLVIAFELVNACQLLPTLDRAYILFALGDFSSGASVAAIDSSRINDIKLPQFYVIPKLHKSPVSSRPLVPSMSWMTSDASRWIAHELNQFLASHIQYFPQVLKDTKSLASLLDATSFSRDCWLSTADVSSLYTNIPHDAGLAALRQVLSDHQHPKVDVICRLMRTVLCHSYTEFDQRTFHQLFGTAMGTPAAPPYAIIFLIHLEKKLLASLSFKPILFLRYIDDLLLVTTCEADAVQFFGCYNKLYPSIKVTACYSPASVDFLDLTIFKNPVRFKLQTKVHQKELNKFLYVPYASYHSRDMKLSFIRTELMRFVRNSSNVDDYLHTRTFFFNALRDRGYPLRFLIEAFSAVEYKNRHIYLGDLAERPPPDAVLKVPLNPRLVGLPWRSLLTLTLSNGSTITPITAWLNPGSISNKLVHAKFTTSNSPT